MKSLISTFLFSTFCFAVCAQPILQRATPEQIAAGVNDSRYVTPKGLADAGLGPSTNGLTPQQVTNAAQTSIGVGASGIATITTNAAGNFTVNVTAASVGAVTSSNAATVAAGVTNQWRVDATNAALATINPNAITNNDTRQVRFEGNVVTLRNEGNIAQLVLEGNGHTNSINGGESLEFDLGADIGPIEMRLDAEDGLVVLKNITTSGQFHGDGSGVSNVVAASAVNWLYAGRVSPRQFGAVADGETDDSEAFQAAIAAKDRLQWIIDLEGLHYRLNQMVDIQSNFVTFQNGSISVTNESLTAFSLSGANSTIQDIQFYGPHTNAVEGSIGLILTNRPHAPYDGSGGPLQGFAVAHATVLRCRFQGWDTALLVGRATHPTVQDNEFTGNRSFSIRILSSDMGRYIKNFNGIASTPVDGGPEDFPDTFFPTNTLAQWISNSVAISIEGHSIVNLFDRNSGGQCKRAFQALSPTPGDIRGIEITGAEIEDIYDYGDFRAVMLFSNVYDITIRQSLFVRINSGLPTAFNYAFFNCPGSVTYVEPGNNYDGVTPSIAIYNTLLSQDGKLPAVFGPSIIRTLSSASAMTGTDVSYPYGTAVKSVGSYTWPEPQVFASSITATGAVALLSPDFVAFGHDAGNRTTLTASTGKEQAFIFPSYAGTTRDVYGFSWGADATRNMLNLGGYPGGTTKGATKIYLLGSGSLSGNSEYFFDISPPTGSTPADFSPVVSSHTSFGVTKTLGKVVATNVASLRFDGNGLGLTNLVTASQTGTHASPSTANPLSPVWTTTQDHTIWYGVSGTINLPAVAGYGNKSLTIYNTGAFTITIDPNGSEVIVRDGTAQSGGVSITLASGAGNFVCLRCDGARWITLGRNGELAEGS